MLDGAKPGTEVVLVPWSVAEAAGWARDPLTVTILDSRKFEPSNDEAVLVRLVTDPTHPMFRDPEEPYEEATWKPLAREKITTGPVSLFDILPDEGADGEE